MEEEEYGWTESFHADTNGWGWFLTLYSPLSNPWCPWEKACTLPPTRRHGAAGRAGPACTGHGGCTTVDTEWGEGGGNGVKKRAIGLLIARYFMLWFGGFLFRNNGQRLRENFQWRGQRMDCRVDCRFHCLCNTWSKHGGALECLTVHFPTLGVCGRKH
jgi:hypothetical protein